MHAEIVQDANPTETGETNELHELLNPVGSVTTQHKFLMVDFLMTKYPLLN